MEHVVLFCAATQQKTVFFKYKNLGQFEYIQGFLNWRWQIISFIILWNFSCIWRESLKEILIWPIEVLLTFLQYMFSFIFKYENLQRAEKPLSHSLFRYLRLFCNAQKSSRNNCKVATVNHAFENDFPGFLAC